MKMRTLPLLLAALTAVTPLLHAATRSWNGSLSGNWATGGNWVGGTAPQAGDDLVFPAGVTRKATTNNFAANTTFRSITVSDAGYVLRGNAVQLQGNASGDALLGPSGVAGEATVALDIRLVGALATVGIEGDNAGDFLELSGDIDLNGHDLNVNGNLRVNGAITGTGDVQSELGVLILAGTTPNTFNGELTVVLGEVILAKTAGVTAVPQRAGGFGFIRWNAANQVSDSATLELASTDLDLNGHAETVSQLEVASGDVDDGTLTVTGDVSFTSGNGALGGSGRISFPVGTHRLVATNGTNSISLELTGAGNLLQVGSFSGGMLQLFHSNSFTGTYTLTNSVLVPRHPNALGNGAAGTFILDPVNANRSAILLYSNNVVSGETLVISGPGSVAHVYPNSGAQLDALSSAFGTNRWDGYIVFAGNTSFGARGGSTLVIDGEIGGAGQLNLNDGTDGTIVFTGNSANTFDGAIAVNNGWLELDKTGGVAVPGALRISNGFNNPSAGVRLRRANQIGNAQTVTIIGNATLDLNGFNDTIGSLELFDGELALNSATLALNGNIEAISGIGAQTINGPGSLQFSAFVEHTIRVHDGPAASDLTIAAPITGVASIRKTDAGRLQLSGANSFSGDFIIAEGHVEAHHASAFGQTTAGVIVSNGASLRLTQPLTFTGESLTVFGANSFPLDDSLLVSANVQWNGNITLVDIPRFNVSSGRTFTLAGAISGDGGLHKSGAGTLRLIGTSDNTFTEELSVRGGELLLGKTNAVAISSRLEVANNSRATLLRGEQIADTALVEVNTGGTWDLNNFNETIGRLFGGSSSGVIDLGSATLTVTEGSFSGSIIGTGGLTKRATGPELEHEGLWLDGTNTYTGATLVQSGNLRVTGHQPQSPVLVLAGGALQGNGVVGNVNVVANGALAPGRVGLFARSHGTLTTSNLTLQAGAIFRPRFRDLTTYDRVDVRGTVSLNEALFAPVLQNFVPTVGDTLTLIANDGADAVVGRFNGIPGGDYTGPGGLTWRMTYTNDVVWSLPTQGMTHVMTNGSNYLDVIVLGGNGNGALDHNECADLLIPLFNDSATRLTNFIVHLSSPVPDLVFNQSVSVYPSLAPGAGAYNLLPFQVSTPTNLLCGTNLPVIATIQSGTNAPFQVALEIPTGRPGAELRLDAAENLPAAVLDGLTVENTVTVEAFTGIVSRVEVSLNVPHELASDLVLTLTTPLGVEIPLVANAGAGPNFGTGCEANQRTRFTMATTQFVGNASAPFNGSVRPAGNLNTMRGKSGDDVIGKWTLSVRDTAHFNVGSLACWSLHLFAATCDDGGGQCDRCPGTIIGDLSPEDPVLLGLPRDASGTNTYCLKQNAVGTDSGFSEPRSFDRYVFTNQSSAATCVSVSIGGGCTNLEVWAAAYVGEFNPTNVALNFAGSVSETPSAQKPSVGFSFSVPPHARFEIIVLEYQPSEGCKEYTLNVDGADICPVRLNVTAVTTNQMRVQWPSFASGYTLERASALPANNWTEVTNEPVILNGRLTVTNHVPAPAGFYRLRKP
jgi:autotransporter-associated beta strand protein